MEDATHDELRFIDGDLARFLASGAWEEGYCSRWVSRLFLVLKPAFNRYKRRPHFTLTSQGVRRAKLSIGRRQALRSHFRDCCMLPYVDDFMFFASNRAQAYAMFGRLTSLLGRLGLSQHPDKGRAQFLLLAITPARFYLRELRDVLRTKDSWSGRVKMTRQLRRDLEWWGAVPNHSNGRSIYKPVETAYMHVDSSSYGWHHRLSETASEVVTIFPPSPDIFALGRLGVRAGAASKRVAEGDADYDRKGKRPAQPAAVEAPSRTIHAPEDGWLDKDGKVHRRHTADARILQRDLDDVFQIYDLLAPAEEPLRDLVEDGTDLPASSPASSAELFKTITAALALCTTVALRINKRGKKLHVEHEYGAEVAKEFDAVDPLGGKGSADYKELKKAIENGPLQRGKERDRFHKSAMTKLAAEAARAETARGGAGGLAPGAAQKATEAARATERAATPAAVSWTTPSTQRRSAGPRRCRSRCTSTCRWSHRARDVLMLEGAERGGSAAATAAQVERAAAAAQPQVGADRAVPEMMEEEEEGRLMEECEACERK
eukprot:jgi/Tetstr1/435162/TSEL_002618.t1